MTTYIRSNRRSWFNINESLKRNGNAPVENKKTSLLKRPDSNMAGDMSETEYYVKVIRDAFKRNMDVKEQ